MFIKYNGYIFLSNEIVMQNYILTYFFTEAAQNENFAEKISEKYPQHEHREFQGIRYFAFPARHQESVLDEVNKIVHQFGLGSKDYIALYYTKPKAPDDIVRHMIVGHDEFIERQLEDVSIQSHQDNLIELMDRDFVKERAQN